MEQTLRCVGVMDPGRAGNSCLAIHILDTLIKKYCVGLRREGIQRDVLMLKEKVELEDL